VAFPNLPREQFCPCGQRVFGAVTVDEEKASKGLFRYILSVWCCGNACVCAS